MWCENHIMKKREGATNIAKLTVLQVSPQTLVTTVRTSEFGLESFGEPLHLPPPLPVFESHELKEWYSGVPLSLMIILRNARFQQLKDTTISFEATSEGRVVFKDSPCVSCPSGESSGSRGCLSELSLFLSRVYIFEKYRIDAESMRKKSAKVALKLWPTCGYFVRLSNFNFWVLIRNKVCKNYLRYFSLSMQEKSTLFTRRRSRKTWWPFF